MGPVSYKCSRCGHIMNEFHGQCPSCGAYLYVKQTPVKPEKPYTKENFRRDVILGVVFIVAAVVGFLFWLPSRTGTVNDSGLITLMALPAFIGFAMFMMAFDKRDKAAGQEPKPTVFQKFSPDQIIGFIGIVISVISLGLGIVGIVERQNPNWRGAVGCLVVPVTVLFVFVYVKIEAKRKKN